MVVVSLAHGRAVDRMETQRVERTGVREASSSPGNARQRPATPGNMEMAAELHRLAVLGANPVKKHDHRGNTT